MSESDNNELTLVLQTEMDARLQSEIQHLLVDFSSVFINLPLEKLDEITVESLGKMAQLVGADRAYIFRYYYDKCMAVNTHEWCAEGIEPQIESLQSIPLEMISEGLKYHMTGKAHYIPDVLSLPNGHLRSILEPQGIKSMIAVPLMVEGECNGCVGFDSVNRHHHYSENEQHLLTLFVQMLVNANHRKESEEALRESRILLNEIQRLSHIGGWEWNIDEQYMTWTDEAYRIHNMTPGDPPAGSPEHIERSLACYADEYREKLIEAFKSCVEDGVSYDIEAPFTSIKGRSRWVRTKGEAVKQNGRIVKVIGNIIDITEKRESEEKVQALLREKGILLKETHHRIKNNMNTIYGLLYLQAENQSDIVCREILHDSACRVKSMMVLYDKLYSSENYHELNVKSYVPPLVDEILKLYTYASPVKADLNIGSFVLNARILSPLSIIINELVTNSLKYAFKNISQGVIKLSLDKEGDEVVFTYSDNGAGLPESVTLENSTGFGMQLVSMLVQQIHGKISIERIKGAVFRITIPLLYDR